MIDKETLFARYGALRECEEALDKALDLMLACYNQGGKILICGNGGSCADAEHISGELLKGFLSLRPIPEAHRLALQQVDPEGGALVADKLQRGIPAIPLPSLSSVLTAYANDVDASLIYAQLTYALGRGGDLLIGISTSGNSKNVFEAMKVAKAMGLSTLALTGKSGGKLKSIADVTIAVPESETYKVQEYHLPVYHYLCARIEQIAFEKGETL